MKNLREILGEKASKLGIELSESELSSFEIYLSELKAWNEHTNLTAITSDEEMISKHVLDSLTGLAAVPKDTRTLVDIGTGAGFPGLPLKIVRPEIDVLLVDSTAKKTAFLTHVIERLGLTGVRALHARAEEMGHDAAYREHFDVATARAVASLPALVELALPLVRVGGVFIAQKSADSGERESSANALAELGGGSVESLPVSLDDLEPRHILVIPKIAPTPRKYPRRPGMPAKRPL
jgi:16S rRNA (guanine527-N7)-methyltransferase